MKKETLKKRLEKEYTRSKSAMSYRVAMDLITGKNDTGMVNGKIIRPVHTSGRGRFTTNLDYTTDVRWMFDLLGLKYEVGNDAPRGGLTGNYIKLLTKIE